MSSARPEMPTFPRGCGWTLVVIGCLSLLIGILSVAAIPLVWQRSEEVWRETPGKITETFVERGERWSNKSGKKSKTRSSAVTFTVMLRYDYTVARENVSGASKCLDQPENDEEYAQVAPILEKYPVGKTIPVFHHSKYLDRSRLTAKEPRQEVILDIVFGGIFTLVGILGLYSGRGILRRRGSRPM